MELKGLRVNAGMTKVMRYQVSKDQAENSGKPPCGVYRKSVRENSILCLACHRWVHKSHKRCSGISGRLRNNVDSNCRRCLDGDSVQAVELREVEIEPGVKVECVPKFCYMGDTLGSGGGVEEAARARVRCAWAKFKELSLISTARGASYRIKRICRACVQSVLTYGTETWTIKVENLKSLERTEHMMVRWMCGVKICAAFWVFIVWLIW